MAAKYLDFHPEDIRKQVPSYFEFKDRKLKENDRTQFYSYLEFREKTKKCLQFTNRFLSECILTTIMSFFTLSYDQNKLIHICSNHLNIVKAINVFVSFVLYSKCILFVILRIRNRSEHVFRSLPVAISIMLVEFISSVFNMGVAFLELIMKNCYFDLVENKIIYLNDKIIKQVIQRTNLHYSFLLHILLSVLIMYTLINLIKHTFLFIEFLKLEQKAFSIIKQTNQP